MNAASPVGDVYPSLTYDDASAAVDWLCRSFGFTRRLIVPGPNQRIEHSELTLGAAVIMVSSPNPTWGESVLGTCSAAARRCPSTLAILTRTTYGRRPPVR